MIALKDIRKDDVTISAKYYPEGKPQGGYLCVRLRDGKVIEHTPDGNYYTDYPPVHAKRRLIELAKLDVVPKESKAYWY